MRCPPDLLASALCDFRLQAECDAQGDGLLPLRDYLPRFPGFEEDVAREYLSVLASQDDRAPGPDDPSSSQYTRVAELGRGGMGLVERVHDPRLHRDLARKVLRRDGLLARRRFQEEARITSRLDHPGVVPVHECGTDAAGRPYFTMRLVEGIDFEDVIVRLHTGDPSWTMPRALEALVKVCDTMAFAHARGIVHRDLKPANVRVGRFGEVYVMDWGLAREMSAEDPHEIRPRHAGSDAPREGGSEDGPPVVTLEGDVLGTPAYMPPEQATGDVAAVGPRSDVYSVGAMLHHLLVGSRPYSEQAPGRRAQDLLELVRAGPPMPVLAIRPTAPRELAAICTKAMQRDPLQRYVDMAGFAADLRAFLDGRVVSAHRSGILTRSRKWIVRNAVLSAVATLALVGGTVALFLIALSKFETNQRLVQLSGAQLKFDFDSLWPPHPASVPSFERWIEDARDYLATRHDNERMLAEMQAHALPIDLERPAERRLASESRERVRQRRALIEHFRQIDANYDSGARGPEGTDRDWIRKQIEGNSIVLLDDLARRVPHTTYEFDDPDDQRLYDAVRRVLAEQTEFEATATRSGLLELAEWGLRASRRVERESIGLHAGRWREAIRSITDARECPMYVGWDWDLTPQMGLVPLGRDPDSGLWEFWHVLSGSEPLRDDRGAVVPDEAMGIVLVLIPPGTFRRGSQSRAPEEPNYDAWAESSAPRMDVTRLAPFFLSKFEMTQGQWARITGSNPAAYQGHYAPGGLLQPVERVTYAEARRVVRVAGLSLPTEAQWEYAARAGTTTAWPSGPDVCTLVGMANFADLAYANSPSSRPSTYADGIDYADGWDLVAPVGRLAANAFGLYDVMGNVREWCSDRGPFAYEHTIIHVFSGERLYVGDGTQAVRGGSFLESPLRARSAAREQCAEGQQAEDLGLRPARNIDG